MSVNPHDWIARGCTQREIQRVRRGARRVVENPHVGIGPTVSIENIPRTVARHAVYQDDLGAILWKGLIEDRTEGPFDMSRFVPQRQND